jgi:hypothetical protein
MSRPAFTWSLTIGAAALAGSTSGYAADYLTVEQAQQTLFPGVPLDPVALRLTPEQRSAIEARAGVRVRNAALKAWRAANGGWFLVDEVLGKHEFITYACGISPQGGVTGIEILSYRETYGGEIRRAAWRDQFVGKGAASPLKLDADIQNISGATLSCRHVTDGVKRLLITYEIVLRTYR